MVSNAWEFQLFYILASLVRPVFAVLVIVTALFFSFIILQTGSCASARGWSQTGILLPMSLSSLDYRCMPPHQPQCSRFIMLSHCILVRGDFITSYVKHVLRCLFTTHVSSSWSVDSSLSPISREAACFLIGCWEFFTYSGYKFFIRYVIYKYFLLVCCIFFHCHNSVFWTAEVANFDEI